MGRLEFEEFELRIGRGHGESYPTWVVRSPAGEANGTFNLPFGPERLKDIKTLVELAMLRSRQRTRAALSSDLRELKTFGGDLFDALFQDAVRATYDSSRNLALSQGKGLRLKLRIEPGELIDLPWEFLYEKPARRFVALSARTPVVRYVELEAPLPPLELTPPLHLLVVVASPSDYAPLNVEREKYRIRLALGELANKGLVEVDFLTDATVPALQDRLRATPVHILHFIGHGGYLEEHDTGVLVFEDEHGEGRRVRGEQLRHLFGDVLTLRLVVLNACSGARGWDRDQDPLRAYPGIAESLVHEGIAGVVANQFEVTDEAAIIFARELYSALADGFPIDAAVTEARKAIDLSLKNTVEWASPVLYSRAPDGLIFDTPGLALASPPPTEEAPVPAFDAATSDVVHDDRDDASVAEEEDGRPLSILSARRPKIGLNVLAVAIGSRLKLAATGILGALLFVAVGFAAGRTADRSVALGPSVTATVEPSATPTATFSPTSEPARPVASATPEPSSTVTPTRTPSSTSTPTPAPTWPESGMPAVIVEVDGFSSFNLRSGPSIQCPVLGGVSAGSQIVAHGGWSSTGADRYGAGWGWVLIEPVAGEKMWIWGAAVEITDPTATLPEIPEDEVPTCAPPSEPLPDATSKTRSQPADNKPKDRDTDSSTQPTATPTPKPTEPKAPTPTPSTIRGIPRPPTPTPGLTSASP